MKKLLVVFTMLALIFLTSACGALSDLIDSGGIESANDEDHKEKTVPAGPDREKACSDRLEFNQNGISFTFAPDLAGSARMEEVEAAPPDQWFAAPGHLHITFEDHLHDQSYIKPSLKIYPLEEYRALSDYAASTIDTLEAIITGKHDLAESYELPYLPEQNAAQVINAGIETLNFQEGRGLRYLAQYAQDVTPVVNDALIYTFQGISADQRHYVSFIYPLAHQDLADSTGDYFAGSEKDYPAFEEGYRDYIEQTRNMLNTAEKDHFSPPLDLLDDVVQSLSLP